MKESVSLKHPTLNFNLLWVSKNAGKAVLETQDISQIIAAVLKGSRNHSGMTLSQVKMKLSLRSSNAVAAFENARRQPTVGKLEELLRATGKRLLITTLDEDYFNENADENFQLA